MYVYYGSCADLNIVLHKSLPLIFVLVCVSLLWLLGNGSVDTFPQQQRIFGGVVFYAAHVVPKESRRLCLTKTSCFQPNFPILLF
jgi:hypothetical protein